VQQHPVFGSLIVEADELLYVHRRHATNASAAHRKHLWQGVMPLQLAGAEAVASAALVTSLLLQPHENYLEDAERPQESGHVEGTPVTSW